MSVGLPNVTPQEKPAPAPPDGRVAHLVLKNEWPRALCGAIVIDLLGTGAPGRDRCFECLRIAQARGLKRPGWSA